jgi:hypothetical protein
MPARPLRHVAYRRRATSPARFATGQEKSSLTLLPCETGEVARCEYAA